MARSNDHWTFAHGLCIGYLNINHIVNKMPDVLKIVHNNQNSDRDVHVFCFSESRLNSHIDDKEVSIASFRTIRKDPLALKTQSLLYMSTNMYLLNALLDMKNMV